MDKLIWMPACLALFLTGCSLLEKRSPGDASDGYGSKDYAEALVSAVPAKWFLQNEKYALLDTKGNPSPHMFFDADPSLDPAKKLVNFIVVTPQNHPVEQKIDLDSGQFYSTRKYCAQGDVWGKYMGEVNRPPYSIGVVPRTLDQLNTPQKIIVFGQEEYYRSYYRTNYFDAKIVGAFIEQVCPERGCVEPGSWLSRLVLVGVQKGNERFKNVETLDDLKKIVDWNHVKAFAENGGGRNLVGGKLYPAFRMGAEVNASQAMAFLKRNSRAFSPQEMEKMASSCHKLYDYMWKSFAKYGKEGLDEKFKLNLFKFRSRYNTCSKYVYSGSVNQDSQRHWFFAHLDAYYRLSEDGYYFNCDRQAWMSNPLVQKNRRLVSLKNQFRYCPKGSVDEAMARMTGFFEALRERMKNSYRYVDYDSHTWGTHTKIYSWVKHDNKVMECNKDQDGVYLKNKLPTFPSDIHWSRFSPAAKAQKKAKKP